MPSMFEILELHASATLYDMTKCSPGVTQGPNSEPSESSPDPLKHLATIAENSPLVFQALSSKLIFWSGR